MWRCVLVSSISLTSPARLTRDANQLLMSKHLHYSQPTVTLQWGSFHFYAYKHVSSVWKQHCQRVISIFPTNTADLANCCFSQWKTLLAFHKQGSARKQTCDAGCTQVFIQLLSTWLSKCCVVQSTRKINCTHPFKSHLWSKGRESHWTETSR